MVKIVQPHRPPGGSWEPPESLDSTLGVSAPAAPDSDRAHLIQTGRADSVVLVKGERALGSPILNREGAAGHTGLWPSSHSGCVVSDSPLSLYFHREA